MDQESTEGTMEVLTPPSLEDLGKLLQPEEKPIDQDELATQLIQPYLLSSVGERVDLMTQEVDARQARRRPVSYDLRSKLQKQAIEETPPTTSNRQGEITKRTNELVAEELTRIQQEETPRLQTVTLLGSIDMLTGLVFRGDVNETRGQVFEQLDPERQQGVIDQVKEHSAEMLRRLALAYLDPEHYNPAAIPALLLSGKLGEETAVLAKLIPTLPSKDREIITAALAIQKEGGAIRFPREEGRQYTASKFELSPGGKIKGFVFNEDELPRRESAAEVVLQALVTKS